MGKIHEKVTMHGQFTVELIRDGKNGPEVIHREVIKNLVVTTGKTETWRAASGLATTLWDHMRIGTSGAAPAAGDTNVKTPVAGTLTTVDSKTMDGTTLQLVKSYPSGGGSICCANIQEVCILNEGTSPGGDALNRSVFTAVTKTTADKLKITYEVRIT